MLTTRRQSSTAPVIYGAWAELLESEERHAAEQGFGAGILVINYGGELLRHVDDHDRALAETATRSVIDRHLRWTDRTELITAGRLGVVVVPIEGALALSHRARGMHSDLRAYALDVDIAFSVRRRTGGLAAAAARADAVLDTSLARRANSGR